MQTSGWDDVKRWVLGFGPTAVVLEPQELREDICRDLSSCLSLYTNKSGGMGQKSL
jgi:predicted DNA-binding transcriptional regulator YafY